LLKLSRDIAKLYEEKKNEIINKIKRIFSFQKLFREAYIILGFNPLPQHSYGSILYFDNDKTIVAVYANDTQKPEKVLDITIHEILHGLIRLNKIKLESSIEELIISISCPRGYLSKTNWANR
jgi:hypothetical protein